MVRHVVGADFRLTDLSEQAEYLVPDDWGSHVASEADREWFEAHPGVHVRMRAATAGEVATMPIGADWRVVVFQIRPGVRLRQFMAPEAAP